MPWVLLLSNMNGSNPTAKGKVTTTVCNRSEIIATVVAVDFSMFFFVNLSQAKHPVKIVIDRPAINLLLCRQIT